MDKNSELPVARIKAPACLAPYRCGPQFSCWCPSPPPLTQRVLWGEEGCWLCPICPFPFSFVCLTLALLSSWFQCPVNNSHLTKSCYYGVTCKRVCLSPLHSLGSARLPLLNHTWRDVCDVDTVKVALA